MIKFMCINHQKIPLFPLERSLIGFCLAQERSKRRCIGLVTGIFKRQAKCVGRDQYNRSYGPFSGTDLKTSTQNLFDKMDVIGSKTGSILKRRQWNNSYLSYDSRENDLRVESYFGRKPNIK